MASYNSSNVAVDLTKYVEDDDLSNDSSYVLTPSEQEFDKLLRDYINGIKLYINCNDK